MGTWKNIMTVQQQKLSVIFDKVLKSLPKGELADALKRDATMNNLMIDRENAMKRKKFIEAETLRRKIANRTLHVQEELLTNLVCHMVTTGDIVKFLELDDRIRFDCCRARIFILMDALDSALNDLQAMTDSVGIRGQLSMIDEVDKARKAIKEWEGKNTTVQDKKQESIILDEADKVYEFTNKRLPVMYRKLNRELKKENIQVGPRETWVVNEKDVEI